MKNILRWTIYGFFILLLVSLVFLGDSRKSTAQGSQPCDNNAYYNSNSIPQCNLFLQAWLNIEKPTRQSSKDCSGTIEGNATLRDLGSTNRYVRSSDESVVVATMTYNNGRKPGSWCRGFPSWTQAARIVAPQTLPNYSGASISIQSRVWGCVNNGYGCSARPIDRTIGPFSIQLYSLPSPATLTPNGSGYTYCDAQRPHIQISWSVANATWLRISRSQGGGIFQSIATYTYPNLPASYTDTNVTTGSSYRYLIEAGNDRPSTASINFGPLFAPDCAPPTADIKAKKPGDPSFSDGPITIPYNSPAIIAWTSEHTTSCSVSPTGWTGISNNPGISTANLTSMQIYTLSCNGVAGGTATNSVRVNVENPPVTAQYFEGLFIGSEIVLPSSTSGQSLTIEYDSSIVDNPPPGFNNLIAPSWLERVP